MLSEISQIVQHVNNVKTYDEALHYICERVRSLLDVEVSSIYLREGGDLVLIATDGLSSECIGTLRLKHCEGVIGASVKAEQTINLEDGKTHPEFKQYQEVNEEQYCGLLSVPIMFHKQAIGALAIQTISKRQFKKEHVLLIITLTAQIAPIMAKVEKKNLLSSKQQTLFKGIKAAPGVTIGKLITGFGSNRLQDIPVKATEQPQREIKKFNKALLQAKKELKEISEVLEKELPEEERLLFETYRNILSKEGLGDEVVKVIQTESLWAASALNQVINRYTKSMDGLNDPYLRDRASDIRDMGRRVLKFLQPSELSRKRFPTKTVIFASEVTASMLAEVNSNRLVGIISGSGSQFSHAAILAKALGIPAVMGIGDAELHNMDMQEVIVDGFHGLVYINPSKQIKREFKRLHDEEVNLTKALEAQQTDEPLQTRCGQPMHLSLNIGLMSELKKSNQMPCDGVGLFRTEISFMQYEHFPNEMQQYKLYKKALDLMPTKPVVMRTLDAGGDKGLAYFQVQEANPFMGWRGVRMTLDHPELFLIQIRAMLRANADYGNLSILLPMVSTIDEVRECVNIIEQAHREICLELKIDADKLPRPDIGVVIEVPAIVFLMDQMPQEISFYSVGTNDLTQYMLAVDRNNHRVADLYNTFHPAIFRILEIALQSAKMSNRKIYVCGEMVSDPMITTVLVGMGFDGFSLNAVSFPRIRQLISQIDVAWARQLFFQIKYCHSAEQVKDLLQEALCEFGVDDVIKYIRQ
jgi:phosphotransferase system, enzyme I, PtsP